VFVCICLCVDLIFHQSSPVYIPVNGVDCICTSTMVIPPITYAFVAALAFSGLNASVGYLTNVLDIPVAQVILIRNVSRAYIFR
jgi:uncharacterized membrane protein